MRSILAVFIITLLSACGGNSEITQIGLAPVISLNGSDQIIINQGSQFSDPGATASDPEDGNISSAISIESNLDVLAVGEYEITYSVTDSAGNSSSVTRIVTVIGNPDNRAPEIILLGNQNETVAFGSDYVDPGYSANDDEDGDLTSSIIVVSNVNTRFPGEYVTTYRVTDSADIQTTVSRFVTVTDAEPQNREDAARFLQRTSFGFTDADVNNLLEDGYEAWLDNQLTNTPSLQLPRLLTSMEEGGFQTNEVLNPAFGFHVQRLREDAWFDAVVYQPDQLRQRVAFALSQIFVISWNDDQIQQRPQGVANYNDILVNHAFGNFRDLLEDVTLNPLMGIYLSMRRNEKADPDRNIQPDENYAREVMQLFTIGLDLLNEDGSVQTDNSGQAIPAYTQQDILNFARVFTGWNYGDAEQLRTNSRTLQSELIPMTAFEDFHDTDAKTLLRNVQVDGGKSAAEDLQIALDNLFNHPNVGPFIGKQLIQKLVTSNPSPEYITRVSRVFDDNGAGVRGDLGAVLKAIMMDPEALLGHIEQPATFGKLKEPLIKLIGLWRAFDAQPVVPGRFRFSGTLTDLGQEHMRSPSVFNFFQPGFSQPGAIRDNNLVSPEFQILDESTAVNMHNEIRTSAMSAEGRTDNLSFNKNRIVLDIEFEKTIADNPQQLLNHVSNKLLGYPLQDAVQDTIIEYIESITLGDGEERVEETIYLIMSTPEYAVQR